MLRIIRPRWTEEFQHRVRHFARRNGPTGSGFCFPADPQGRVLVEELPPAALANFRSCMEQPALYKDLGSEEWSNYYTHPALAVCTCGAEIELDGDTCCERCGAEYNSAGQRLAPREQWGEETGETLADITGPARPEEDW